MTVHQAIGWLFLGGMGVVLVGLFLFLVWGAIEMWRMDKPLAVLMIALLTSVVMGVAWLVTK